MNKSPFWATIAPPIGLFLVVAVLWHLIVDWFSSHRCCSPNRSKSSKRFGTNESSLQAELG